ncbi:hypothetical protein TTRE_0000749801 [Trichuris trichiura]|uniref:ZNF380 coiled-coil domain-containing protein n=1 Tax=Trichuris trichiura TaxID=36087 RepID=A0A077ZHX1_TRITR|nr:hypothetical protein TTRE_0000749801 [Trichuris trichiura]
MSPANPLAEPAIEAMMIGTVVCVTLLIATVVTLLACGGCRRKKKDDDSSSSSHRVEDKVPVPEVKVEQSDKPKTKSHKSKPKSHIPQKQQQQQQSVMDTHHKDVEQAASLRLMTIRKGEGHLQSSPAVKQDAFDGPSLHLMTKLIALKEQKLHVAAQASSSSVEKRKAEEEDDSLEAKKAKLSEDESDVSSDISVDEGEKLPEDFFDESMETSTAQQVVSDVSVSVENSIPEHAGKPSEKLETGIPEGFFDDPVEDAKKRGAELKDPLDEEWSRFQKELLMEENIADDLLEGDLEQMNLERSLDELDEEIRGWARVNVWEKKVEEALEKPKASSVQSSPESLSDLESDEADLEAILDWRSKEYL